MMSLTEAEQIADDCIRQAVGWADLIKPSNKLKEIGVVDDTARGAVNDEIVTNPEIGVASVDHQLEADELSFTINSKFFELRDEIFNKADEIGANALRLTIVATRNETRIKVEAPAKRKVSRITEKTIKRKKKAAENLLRAKTDNEKESNKK